MAMAKATMKSRRTPPRPVHGAGPPVVATIRSCRAPPAMERRLDKQAVATEESHSEQTTLVHAGRKLE
jgi:hypothetical protein